MNKKGVNTAAITLGIICFVTWLLLSGYFANILLLTLGVLSCVLVVFIALRMRLLEADMPTIGLSLRLLSYLPWLLWEIVKANIDVVKRVLNPNLPISPSLFRCRASQATDLGKVIYANSITLTPGTISVRIDGDEIEVHALSRDAAEGLLEGTMDRRVTKLERRQGRDH